jgi:uncharacterized protein
MAQPGTTPPKHVTITFHPDGQPSVDLTCDVAHTYAEKTKGLMYRSLLPTNQGMLFPFWFSWYRTFWMKNVFIPLDIIFINKKFKVVAIHETNPSVGFFNKKFWAAGLGKYIIECNHGFCTNHHIGRGTIIHIQDNKTDAKKHK